MPDPVLTARGRLARASRQDGDPKEREQAFRAFRIAKLEQAVQRALAEAPPLTDDQRARIAALLRPQGGERS